MCLYMQLKKKKRVWWVGYFSVRDLELGPVVRTEDRGFLRICWTASKIIFLPLVWYPSC